MKTFEEALEERIKDLPTPNYEEDNFDAGVTHGFESGAEWASKSPELINEILTKYMEWVDNTPRNKFADWLCEEGDYDKNDARIRKEFINYLNEKKWKTGFITKINTL